MKKLTIMVMPHGLGATRTFTVYTGLLWTVVGGLLILSLLLGFFFEQYRAARGEVQRLEKINAQLRVPPPAAPNTDGVRAEERDAIEENVRAEYEARYEAIEGDLSELYDLEGEVRAIHGLPPRPTNGIAPQGGPGWQNSGQGGQLTELDEELLADVDVLSMLPSIIYGLSDPSVDLIVQEIRLRTGSLRSLLDEMEQKRDFVERTPSIWPSPDPDRWISSRFGYRKDPFTQRIRHHSGTDIVAPYGSPVISTGKGVVRVSGYDRYLGNIIKVDHGNGLETWYGHLRKCLLKKGDEVERGELIGTVGNTGRSTSAHIHYEVRVDGKPVDSAKYLGK